MYSNTKSIIYIVFAIVLNVQLAFSQHYNFRNYGVSDGLPQSQVYALVQDKHDYLWAGTRGGGVAKFDGLKFTQYTESDGLVNNFIRCQTIDKQGNIWFGTDEGLSKFDGKQFINFDQKQGLNNNIINDLCFNSDNKLIVATENGLFIENKQQFIPIDFPQKRIICLYKNADNRIWVGTQFGVYILENNKVVQIINEKNGLSNNDVTAITADEFGNTFISTYGGGINIYDGKNLKRILVKDGLPHKSIYTIYYAGNKQLWIGSSQGATVLNYQNDYTFRYYNVSNGLSVNMVKRFLKDSEGNMWVGTSGGGLCKIDNERFVHFKAEKNVLGELIFDVKQVPNGDIWFASTEGGITVFDGKKLTRIAEKQGITSGKIKCIYKTKSNDVWLGSTGNGAYLYTGNNFKHFDRKSGLSSLFINAIASDKQGRVWFATAGGSVCYYSNGKFVKINPKSIGSDRINTVFVDSKDNIWLGTLTAGIVKINAFTIGDELQIQTFKNAGNNIRCIIEDKNGNILVGSAGKGIFQFVDNEFTEIKTEKSFSKNIYFLHQDKLNNLWAGTDKGLFKFNITKQLHTSNTVLFNRTSGFKGIEATHNAVCEDKLGNIWFGSIAGAFKYNPQEERKSIKSPSLHITSINLFFDPIQNTPYFKNASPWFAIPQQLDLPYDKNSLSFQFSGIYLTEPEAVTYSWKMQGFDNDWSPENNRAEAIYSNLPSGNYTFMVKAKYNGGSFDDNKIQQFSFTIQAPFWQKWWFKIAITLFVSAIILSAYYLRIRTLKEKNKSERELLETEKKLLELEQKALHLQMNPHFLFNCLNSIKGLIAQNKAEEAKTYLNRFAKLMRAILDSSRENYISLEKEIELIKHYVELEKLSLSNNFELIVQYSNIPDPSAIQIPPMLIQPFVENAIVHGLALLKTNGKITINFEKVDAHLLCTIEDNGIGRIKASEFSNNNNLDKHKSTAILVIKERLKILTNNENAVLIEDIFNETGINTGTRIKLIINYLEE